MSLSYHHRHRRHLFRLPLIFVFRFLIEGECKLSCYEPLHICLDHADYQLRGSLDDVCLLS